MGSRRGEPLRRWSLPGGSARRAHGDRRQRCTCQQILLRGRTHRRGLATVLHFAPDRSVDTFAPSAVLPSLLHPPPPCCAFFPIISLKAPAESLLCLLVQTSFQTRAADWRQLLLG